MKSQDPLDHRSELTTPLGRLIYDRRVAAGLSQRQLAEDTGVSRVYISKIERGAYRQPRPQVLMKFAKRLNINLADLYAVTGYWLPEDLPEFPAYLRAKHPDWPEPLIRRLADFYDFETHRRLSR